MTKIQLNSVQALQFLILFLFLAAFPVFSQQSVPPGSPEKGRRDKDAKALLSLLEKQIGEIRANQIDYIAEEEQRQTEYDENGKLKRQRQILSNYYRVKLGEGVVLLSECREVVMVDGKPVGDGRKLQELLLSKDKSMNEQIHKIMDQSRKYNLGSGRYTNQPFGGLRFADRDRQEHAEFYTDPAGSNSGDELKLYFRENDDATMFQHNMPFSKWAMPAAGHYLFALENKLFLGYDICIHGKNGAPWSRLVARYGRMKDGKLLPVSFEEYTYHKNGQIKTRSVSEYKNYRHFTVDAKIIHFESIE